MAIFSLAVPVAVALAGTFCFLMAMGGSIAWLLATWSLNLPLLAAMAVAIFGAVRRANHFPKRRILCLLSLAMTLPLTALFGQGPLEIWMNGGLHRFPNLEHSSGTRVEFQLGEMRRTIHDPHDQLRFYLWSSPDHRAVESGVRVLVFKSPASLNSWSESYAVGPDGIDYGGWMGADLTDPEIWIDQEGKLDSAKRSVNLPASKR